MAIIITGSSPESSLAELVLEKMGVLDPGETVSAEDEQTVTDGYNRLYQELLIKNLVNWTSTDDVPLWAGNSVADILAYRLRVAFSVPQEKIQELLINKDSAMRDLRVFLSPTYAPDSDHVFY